MSKLDNLRRPRVEIPKRRRLTKAEKVALDQRDGHACVICGVDRDLQEEHRIARAIKPDDTIANVRWMCSTCHKPKTAADRKIIAKAKGLEKKHFGMKPPTKHPLRSRGFDKGSKQKIPSRPFQNKPRRLP